MSQFIPAGNAGAPEALVPSMRIEIWSDVVCPWCYVGKRRFEQALAEFPGDVEVEYRAFELDPSPDRDPDESEAQMLARKFGRTEQQARQMLDEMTRTAAGEGLEFHYDTVVQANTFLAHQLIAYATSRGLGREAKERLLRAHFTDGLDVGDQDTLVRLADEIGLDGAADALASGAYAGTVREQQEQARAFGITGVPFFVIDRKYGVSGAQPSAAFLQVLQQAAAG